MPIEITCDGCKKRLRIPDTAAGKRVKCPQCQHVLRVPDASEAASADSGNWQLQVASGEVYGPISKAELDEWYAEGRVTAECQLLRESAEQWQWASDIYPALAQSEPQPETAETPESAPAESDDPFAFLGADDKTSTAPSGEVPSFDAPAPVPAVREKAVSLPAAGVAATETAGISPRDQLAAALLGIFGGAWGLHRFYLGDSTGGIIRIVASLTCIGALWGIIEGFMLLGAKPAKDAKGRTLRRERF